MGHTGRACPCPPQVLTTFPSPLALLACPPTQAVVFFLCVIVAAAIIIPLRMVVRKWIRDRIARAFAARRHAQHPPHPPYQQLYQYPYAQHYSPLPTSAPPGSVPHVAAAGGPAAGPAAAAAAANTHVAVGYPVINSPPPQQHLLAVPAEAAAEPDKLVSHYR